MYICIIDSDNGLAFIQHQAIIWTNGGIFMIQTLATKLSEILIIIQTFSFKKMHFKCRLQNDVHFASGSMC